MIFRRIIPSITTISPGAWRKKIAEIAPLGLRQVAVFATGLSKQERAECWSLLSALHRVHDFSIPFVHAVSSMQEHEYRFMIEKFGTEAFNLHSQEEYPLEYPLSEEIKKKIYIENTKIECAIPTQDLCNFAGICFDLSHLEDSRRSCFENYQRLINLAGKFPVGVNHISAVSRSSYKVARGFKHYSRHDTNDPDEMKYPAQLDPMSFAQLCAIELENTLQEQVNLLPTIEAALRTADENSSRVAA